MSKAYLSSNKGFKSVTYFIDESMIKCGLLDVWETKEDLEAATKSGRLRAEIHFVQETYKEMKYQ